MSQVPTQWGNVAGAALLFGVVLFGVVLSGFGMWGLARAAPTSSWPGTAGIITESSVESVARSGPDEPNIRYDYSVSGRRFTGTRIGYLRLVTDADTRGGSSLGIRLVQRCGCSTILDARNARCWSRAGSRGRRSCS